MSKVKRRFIFLKIFSSNSNNIRFMPNNTIQWGYWFTKCKLRSKTSVVCTQRSFKMSQKGTKMNFITFSLSSMKQNAYIRSTRHWLMSNNARYQILVTFCIILQRRSSNIYKNLFSKEIHWSIVLSQRLLALSLSNHSLI